MPKPNMARVPLTALQQAKRCREPVWTPIGFQKCRRCALCVEYEAWQWQERVKIEMRKRGESRIVFATWTFRPRGKNWTPTVEGCKQEVTKVLKRMRHAHPSLRYLSATEFGDERGRVHQHFLFHGLSLAKQARTPWKQGYTHARWARAHDIRYVAEYCAKDQSTGRRMVSLNYGNLFQGNVNEILENDALAGVLRAFRS